jgi:hypothetical protein
MHILSWADTECVENGLCVRVAKHLSVFQVTQENFDEILHTHPRVQNSYTHVKDGHIFQGNLREYVCEHF